MPVQSVASAQWGDEIKRGIVGIPNQRVDIVASYHDGANTGPIIVVDGNEHILDSLDELKACIGCQLNGRLPKTFPTDRKTLEIVVPECETFEDWKTKTSDLTLCAELSINAPKYVKASGSFTATEATMIPVGTRCHQMLFAG